MNDTRPNRVPVLVDANAIIEAHRTRSWSALAGGWRVETVEGCVTETQTGSQRRRPEQTISLESLRASLASVHQVSDRELAELAVQVHDIALDEGEELLWAHALGRDRPWVMCGPDKASLRCGIRLGFRERLLSLQELLEATGHRPKVSLREQYTKKWLDMKLSQFVMEEGNY